MDPTPLRRPRAGPGSHHALISVLLPGPQQRTVPYPPGGAAVCLKDVADFFGENTICSGPPAKLRRVRRADTTARERATDYHTSTYQNPASSFQPGPGVESRRNRLTTSGTSTSRRIVCCGGDSRSPPFSTASRADCNRTEEIPTCHSLISKSGRRLAVVSTVLLRRPDPLPGPC